MMEMAGPAPMPGGRAARSGDAESGGPLVERTDLRSELAAVAPPPCPRCGDEAPPAADGACPTCGSPRPVVRDHVELVLGDAAAVTDRGLRRRRNEDAVELGRRVEGGVETWVAVVCDGVASARRGDEASLAAVGAAVGAALETAAAPATPPTGFPAISSGDTVASGDTGPIATVSEDPARGRRGRRRGRRRPRRHRPERRARRAGDRGVGGGGHRGGRPRARGRRQPGLHLRRGGRARRRRRGVVDRRQPRLLAGRRRVVAPAEHRRLVGRGDRQRGPDVPRGRRARTGAPTSSPAGWGATRPSGPGARPPRAARRPRPPDALQRRAVEPPARPGGARPPRGAGAGRRDDPVPATTSSTPPSRRRSPCSRPRSTTAATTTPRSRWCRSFRPSTRDAPSVAVDGRGPDERTGPIPLDGEGVVDR